jgi:LmbE family N-acetylglucosaminyl deacetylase
VRLTCIHAHPDDAEILAGGTLALLSDLGHHITIVTMTPGDCGSGEYGPDELSAIRKAEAKDAAALIGADYLCAGFSDLSIFNDDPSRRRVTAVLRELKPDVVLTASPIDYHCDHEATSILVTAACFGAPIPNYIAGMHDPLPSIPHLYFLDPIDSPVTPDFIIDVTLKMDLKAAMLAKHVSQRAWLKRQHGIDDYIERMKEWTRTRGGEGFRQYKVHPWPQTPLLQTALGAAYSS